jgi:hypothetical protein
MPLELFLCIRLTSLVEHGDIQPHLLPIRCDDLHVDLESVALELGA